MNCVLCYKMLSVGELEVLAALDEPSTVSSLAASLDRSDGHVSKLVTSLAEKGLVEGRREGREKVVRPLSYEAVNRYLDVTRKYPHVDFPELLQGKAIPILYYLDDPITVSDLAERTDNYRNTVHRIVKRFQNRGIIKKREGTYVLNDDFKELNQFARSLVTHSHVVNAPVSGTILWETLDEFLLQTTSQIDDDSYLPTGPSRFAEFDIPLLMTDQRYYFYSERIDELTPADVVCHTLLIDDSARYKGYCLLLIVNQEIDEDHLRERASHFGLDGLVDDLLDYLETEGESGPEAVASWDEFRRLAAEYGVAV